MAMNYNSDREFQSQFDETPEELAAMTPAERLARSLRNEDQFIDPDQYDLAKVAGEQQTLDLDDVEGGKYAEGANYVALSHVKVDVNTGESTSNLMGISPIDYEFGDTPPPEGRLSTRNVDFDVGGRVPDAEEKWEADFHH